MLSTQYVFAVRVVLVPRQNGDLSSIGVLNGIECLNHPAGICCADRRFYHGFKRAMIQNLEDGDWGVIFANRPEHHDDDDCAGSINPQTHAYGPTSLSRMIAEYSQFRFTSAAWTNCSDPSEDQSRLPPETSLNMRAACAVRDRPYWRLPPYDHYRQRRRRRHKRRLFQGIPPSHRRFVSAVAPSKVFLNGSEYVNRNTSSSDASYVNIVGELLDVDFAARTFRALAAGHVVPLN
ncbi:MAG: hypothetical protein M1833_001971 [Piccolia ochrophora]|nr:MAG: hypothetical protein M1833_001971 [Piccolia ochrophora]